MLVFKEKNKTTINTNKTNKNNIQIINTSQ